VVILGHNARLGWGFTNAMADDMDFVIEQLSADSTRVRTTGGLGACRDRRRDDPGAGRSARDVCAAPQPRTGRS